MLARGAVNGEASTAPPGIARMTPAPLDTRRWRASLAMPAGKNEGV
jgi:hypothetical protein